MSDLAIFASFSATPLEAAIAITAIADIFTLPFHIPPRPIFIARLILQFFCARPHADADAVY